jgi:hypothetical protein
MVSENRTNYFVFHFYAQFTAIDALALIQTNPIHAFPRYFSEIHFNIIPCTPLSSHSITSVLVLSQWVILPFNEPREPYAAPTHVAVPKFVWSYHTRPWTAPVMGTTKHILSFAAMLGCSIFVSHVAVWMELVLTSQHLCELDLCVVSC